MKMRKAKIEAIGYMKWKAKELSKEKEDSDVMMRWNSKTNQDSSEAQRHKEEKRIKVVFAQCTTL